MARKSKGLWLILLGCALLVVAGGWYAYNLSENAAAEQKSASLIEQFDLVQPDTSAADTITLEGEVFCGKLAIPALEIELPVYDEWSYKRLKTAPCRYVGRVATDDIIIAAHNYHSHFGQMNRLRIGDEISFTDASGKTHRYTVCELTMLDGTAVTDMQSGGWDLTLFTCTKSGKQRVTVRCERDVK